MKIFKDEKLKTITFADERYYFDDKTGNWYPSATTVLDVYPKGYGFQKWLKELGSNADQVLKEAGEQGTLIHNTIETLLKGEEVIWDDSVFNIEQWKMLLKFKDFITTHKPEIIAIEHSMVDSELGFGGTLDLICKINGEIWLVDWKSSNGIYKSHELQISSYVKMWNKQNPTLEVKRMGLLHLKALTKGADKTCKCIQGEGWKLHEPVQTPGDLYKLFEMTRQIWLFENPNAKPKNLVYPSVIKI